MLKAKKPNSPHFEEVTRDGHYGGYYIRFPNGELLRECDVEVEVIIKK